MKVLIAIFIVLVLLTTYYGFVAGLRNYHYSVDMGQYLKLADDSSLPKDKADYLIKYKDSVLQNVTREQGRYIFKQDRFTKTIQLKNLDSLIKRLQDIAILTPDSFAYQQGMEQISGQEFDHTIQEIDTVFSGCWYRQSLSRYLSLTLAFIFGIAAVIPGMAVLANLGINI